MSSSSATSCCAPTPTARPCGCATSPASSSAASPTPPRRASTASLRSASAIQLAPGGNALESAKAGARQDGGAVALLPAGHEVGEFRTTARASCKISIEEVVETLVEAVVLVFLVMFLFLQNCRATLIPTIVVPVVLLGTFGVLLALGFSINALTMFGMVLAIGLLVDDAIVVVENVERVMSEEGLSPREATLQVDGADHRRPGRHRAGAGRGVRADGLLRRLDRRDLPPVLGHHRVGDGPVGAAWRWSLTPALCATLLKPVPQAATPRRPDRLLRLVQPQLRPRQQPLPGRRAHMLAQGLALPGRLRGAARRRWCSASCGCRRRSCPTKTRARCSCSMQLPPAPPPQRTDEVILQVEHHFLDDRRTRSPVCSPCRASASRAAARTPASPSSS